MKGISELTPGTLTFFHTVLIAALLTPTAAVALSIGLVPTDQTLSGGPVRTDLVVSGLEGLSSPLHGTVGPFDMDAASSPAILSSSGLALDTVELGTSPPDDPFIIPGDDLVYSLADTSLVDLVEGQSRFTVVTVERRIPELATVVLLGSGLIALLAFGRNCRASRCTHMAGRPC